ncbi:MAG: STAS domain-containing protein [Bdellovibrio sp.]|nr:STAS domain-containing protein [Bdellovibrio sp.]
MRMDVRRHDDKILLTVLGDIDDYTYPLFAHELEMLDRIASQNLLINLEGCPFLNFQCIRLMVDTHRRFHQAGRRVVFRLGKEKRTVSELMKIMTLTMGSEGLNIDDGATGI